jgi:PAS domain S-box-containing protein
MRRSQEKYMDIGIILVIISIITIAVFSYQQTKKSNIVSARIGYTQNVLQRLSQLYNTVIDHAGSARNYAMNGGEKNILSIQSTAADLLLKLEELKPFTNHNPAQLEYVDSLTKYIQKRIDVSNQIIITGKENGVAAANALYQMGAGREYNNITFSFIQKMQSNELENLKADEEKSSFGIRQLGSYLVALLAFLLMLIIIIIQRIRMDINKRKKTEKQLTEFNKTLEEQVRIKTADIKRSEEKLLASEKNIRQVLSSATDNFYVIDRDYRITIINEIAEKNLKAAWKHPVTVGTNILDYIPSEKDEPIRSSFKKAFAGENVEYDLYIYVPGLPNWVLVTYLPVRDETKTIIGVYVATKDISERKAAEEIIKASEERYRSLIEQASDAIMITDTKGDFTDVNPAFCKQFGYEKEEVLKMNISQFIDPEQLKTTPLHFKELVAGKNIIGERRMLHKDGSIVDVESNVKMIPGGRLLAIARDIRERKRTEQEKEQIRYLLNERVKELTTLYQASRLLQTEDKSTTTVLKEFISIVPGAWQYPEITAARLVVNDIEISTPNFGPGPHKQTAEFQTFNDLTGLLEIVYLEERPTDTEGPFMAEERNLINMLAEMLQIYFNKKCTTDELKVSYEQIRLLASHIENVREEEKIKIAREIHDELGQQITGLKMDISWVSDKIGPADKVLHEKTKEILSLLDDTVKSVRRISTDLRPGILDDFGLVAALEWQSKEFEKRSGIKTKFDSPFPELITPANISTGLFRIFQESLTNVARHAEASQIFASITKIDNEVVLKITDNGKGFDVSKIGHKHTLGLLGMKERTMIMGGDCNILSEKNKGTTVLVSVPLIE